MDISIHAPRVGSDPRSHRPTWQPQISIHAPRVGCLLYTSFPKISPKISIHAPRVGSDFFKLIAGRNFLISIHAPRVGSDRNHLAFYHRKLLFQSTLPVWGATTGKPPHLPQGHISIHAPRVGSDTFLQISRIFLPYFNPRSPCGERPRMTGIITSLPTFQSTLPVWGATRFV